VSSRWVSPVVSATCSRPTATGCGPCCPAQTVAARWADARRLVVTGRGLAYAAALETALKIKETARVHAEGLSSADLLHGPIAALDSRLPVLVVSGGGRFAADEAELTARLSAEDVPFAVCGAVPNAALPLPVTGAALLGLDYLGAAPAAETRLRAGT
jgi:SIS domain